MVYGKIRMRERQGNTKCHMGEESDKKILRNQGYMRMNPEIGQNRRLAISDHTKGENEQRNDDDEDDIYDKINK